MKKLNLVYYIPPIAVTLFYLLVSLLSGDFVAPKLWCIIIVLFVSAVIMSLGKAWGALPPVAVFAGIAVLDWLKNHKTNWQGQIMAEYKYCIPVIVFYLICAVIVLAGNVKKKK